MLLNKIKDSANALVRLFFPVFVLMAFMMTYDYVGSALVEMSMVGLFLKDPYFYHAFSVFTFTVMFVFFIYVFSLMLKTLVHIKENMYRQNIVYFGSNLRHSGYLLSSILSSLLIMMFVQLVKDANLSDFSASYTPIFPFTVEGEALVGCLSVFAALSTVLLVIAYSRLIAGWFYTGDYVEVGYEGKVVGQTELSFDLRKSLKKQSENTDC